MQGVLRADSTSLAGDSIVWTTHNVVIGNTYYEIGTFDLGSGSSFSYNGTIADEYPGQPVDLSVLYAGKFSVCIDISQSISYSF